MTVTDTGVTVAADIASIDGQVRSRLRRDVSREDRQMLASLLVRLQHNLISPNQPNGEPR